MFDVKEENLTEEQKREIIAFKDVIFDGFKQAVAESVPKENAAVLVDEQYGDRILRDAKFEGVGTILTTERSGQKKFFFEFGDGFGDHIERFKPTFAKALVHYNPEDEPEFRQHQLHELKRLSDYCASHESRFLLEVLIGATSSQLAACHESQEEYDRVLRPKLTVQMMEEMQTSGVEPDIWKMEGLESTQDYEMVLQQARSGGRESVGFVILGRGATDEKVEEWIRNGAKVPGVIGFAVGRTIFWESLVQYHGKQISRDEAVKRISHLFQHFYKVFVESK
jgi:5-dehydro-2-deoxygluconokinase